MHTSRCLHMQLSAWNQQPLWRVHHSLKASSLTFNYWSLRLWHFFGFKWSISVTPWVGVEWKVHYGLTVEMFEKKLYHIFKNVKNAFGLFVFYSTFERKVRGQMGNWMMEIKLISHNLSFHQLRWLKLLCNIGLKYLILICHFISVGILNLYFLSIVFFLCVVNHF